MSDRHKSSYATKRDSGKQMYGPGCCGHKITNTAIDRRREEAKREGHHFWTPRRGIEEGLLNKSDYRWDRRYDGADYRRYGT